MASTMFRQATETSADPTPASGERTWFETMTMPLLPVVARGKRRQTNSWPRWYQDHWFVALLICAACASSGAALWAYQSHTILLYADAHSHLLIARRVTDNIYPGLAQLGDVWLPLPQIIMAPLAMSDFLWRTGLAGTFTSLPCYLIATVYVFLTARRLTRDSRASFVGSLVFVLNPNILYLQTTPLSEPVLFATLAAASYYLVVWAQDDQMRDLIYAAMATFLATISRYDGWALYLAFIAAIVLIDWNRYQQRSKIVSDVVLFAVLGGIGIVLWFVWNLVIFGSPIAFLDGTYSSQSQTASFIHRGVADDYHNLWQSIRTYSIAVAESIGPALFVIGILALIVFLYRRRFSSGALAAATMLVPFAFYIVAFFLGQDVLYIPYANHPPSYAFYNARFGAEMAAPAAVFIATLAQSARRWLPLAEIALLLMIIGQSTATSWGGVVSFQDGQIGASCYQGHPVVAFLAQHYDSGRLLVNVYSTNLDLAPVGIPFHNEIYEGDTALWADALQDPAKYVDWIIIAPHDLISQHIDTQSPAFRSAFVLMAQDDTTGITLWRRNGLPPLPTRPLPDDAVAPYATCNHAKGSGLASIQHSANLIAASPEVFARARWPSGSASRSPVKPENAPW